MNKNEIERTFRDMTHEYEDLNNEAVYDEEFYYDDVDLAPLYAEMSRCS